MEEWSHKIEKLLYENKRVRETLMIEQTKGNPLKGDEPLLSRMHLWRTRKVAPWNGLIFGESMNTNTQKNNHRYAECE